MKNEQETLQVEVLHLNADDIVVGKNLGRPYSAGAEADAKEMEEIQAMADTMVKDGQLQPVEVRMDMTDGKYHLVWGFRRLQAIQLANMTLDKPMVVLAIPRDVDEAGALRHAAIENLKRKNLSPMDMVGLIETVRTTMKFKGKPGTKKVADFLGVSEATVTQYEKLDNLVDEIKAEVHKGALKLEGAIVLAKVAKEKQVAALADANNMQQVTEAKKAASGGGKGKGKGSGGRKTGAVQTKHVKKAASKQLPDGEKPPLSKGDIIDFFADYIDAPAAAYEEVQEFVKYFCEKFVKGKGSYSTAAAKFNALVEGGKRTRIVAKASEVVDDMKATVNKTHKRPSTPKAKK